MVTNDWSQDSSLNRLERSSEEYNFFQLVRLLEGRSVSTRLPVELKFSGNNSLAFKPNFVDDLAFEQSGGHLQATVSTNGFHLLGQQGPVPNVYVEQIASISNQGQNGASEYLDIYNDRILKALYEIKKNFSPMLFNGEEEEKNLFAVFEAVSGVSADSVYESKLPKKHSRFWRKYAYLISNRRVSYSVFKEVISAEINAEVKISPASGGWRKLGESSQAKLDGSTRLDSSRSLGQRFWGYSNCLELTLTFSQIDEYFNHLPSGEQYSELIALLAVLSDLFFDIDLNFRLAVQEVPVCKLGGPVHLGQATWLASREAIRGGVDGARFHLTRQEMLSALQESAA